jgi:ssRNA-specific RNase YbeY (16S rRNA maturation enzyme)
VLHLWKVEHTKNQNICNTIPKSKEVNLFLLTDTMHSAKDKHFRSFPIGTEVLSFADSKDRIIQQPTHEHFQRGRKLSTRI